MSEQEEIALTDAIREGFFYRVELQLCWRDGREIGFLEKRGKAYQVKYTYA